MRRPACVIGVLAMLTATAAAEGEYGPMVGGSLVATHGEDDLELGGVELELAVWHGRVGLAIAASQHAGVDSSAPRATAVDGSLRLLLLRTLIPSLLDSRDTVELGFELHGIVERTWWTQVDREPDPTSYGLGLAVRLRGGSDDFSSNLLAESRVFVRALTTREAQPMDAVARSIGSGDSRDVRIIVGLGVMFGGGKPHYVERFRRQRPLDSATLIPR
ncbi:MAG: hypothetical protein ABI867_40035 [Kofleriaceae bacterium]